MDEKELVQGLAEKWNSLLDSYDNNPEHQQEIMAAMYEGLDKMSAKVNRITKLKLKEKVGRLASGAVQKVKSGLSFVGTKTFLNS